ncbi:hypothetical protein FRX31_008182 [Thalictrum thalictroides]|uniref:Uncharacterized protein n=1 Tax=Thalictrum thalictroides TaxID=46969 RepID=A0A7J6X078_THATH|nr:hypothetical protein FRX31_008182 [Thalictrum thalictroides]
MIRRIKCTIWLWLDIICKTVEGSFDIPCRLAAELGESGVRQVVVETGVGAERLTEFGQLNKAVHVAVCCC